MYISAYTDIDGIVISYTIVHTQHNTWREKNIQYIGPVKQGCEKWRDESGLLWKKNRIINNTRVHVQTIHKDDGTFNRDRAWTKDRVNAE